MSARRDPDRLIHAFLLEGAEQLNDQIYDAVRAGIEQKRQRAVIGPWRMPTIMNKLVPIGLGAAAVAVAIVFGTQLLGPASGDVGAAPPSAGPSPTAAPSPRPEPSPVKPSSAPSGFLPEGPFTIVDEGSPNNPVAATVIIPASGWTYDPAYGLIEKGDDGEPPEAVVLAWSWPVGTGFYVYGDPCRWVSTTPNTPATTVDQIATALAAQASRDASAPVDVTVGGHAGKRITLHVPSDARFADCDQGNFASYGTEGPGGGPSRYHQGPGQVDELWILDVDGAVAIIDAAYRPNTPAELVEEMRSIAGSATFTSP